MPDIDALGIGHQVALDQKEPLSQAALAASSLSSTTHTPVPGSTIRNS